MLHHSPAHFSPHHHALVEDTSSPTDEEDPPHPGEYESAEDSGCEGIAFSRSYQDHSDLSHSPPTPPVVARPRSHTYCGPELTRLPFLARDMVERCYSNDALWSHLSQRRRSSSACTNSEELLYETRSSISSASSLATPRRKSISRCLPVEEEDEDEDLKGCVSLRRALSSLSLRLLQGERERPVQRILRPPRRRQTTRGLSGLQIESVNQWNSAVTMSG